MSNAANNFSSFDRMFNGSAESQATAEVGDYKEFGTAYITHDCGTRSPITLVRERGRFHVLHGDYTESFRSKKAAIAAYPQFAG